MFLLDKIKSKYYIFIKKKKLCINGHFIYKFKKKNQEPRT